MFFTPSIKSRVMAVMNKRIADAQAEFDSGSIQLAEECETKMQALEQERDTGIERLADRLVNSIVGSY